ncbi:MULTISPECIES: cyclically-permuted mutarotase family protein [Proteiniphilum]|jgi:sialate O-acetylesterase|uniref:cyclically-permuted mutarotase family protein n=1 Tax=Proteiniphilum TaxID=294702 RepID=UPI001EE9CCA2|nr:MULTISPECIES: cyclically-permuted mutarotase family protein [Proteiniphilum]ULB34899.1 cyclically-permuted mutarotase family protein [Proteiniphilum propionicum]
MKNVNFFILFFLIFGIRIFAGPVKVACVGNSVTFGVGIENQDEKYPAQLQAMLGKEYEVKNFGHSGASLLKNGFRPYWILPEFEEAISYKPDIVIIHLGLNDTDPRSWPKFRDEFVRDYSSLIDTFKTINPGAEVKICRLTPIFTGHKRFKSSTRDWFWQVQDALETVAEINNVALIDLHTPLYRRPDLLPDAVHPTGEGAGIIARTVYGAITQEYGGLRLAPPFSSGMVLQRKQPIVFWGTANGGSEVAVKFNTYKKSAVTGADGKWEIEFPALEAGGPYTAVIENGISKIILKDILIGDVWLCSGQSNMEFILSKAATASEDIPGANFPKIRLLNMQPVAYTNNEAWEEETLEKINRLQYFTMGEWQRCTPETAGNFSAVAYHFGKKIHQETGVPMGLILNATGGSPAEAWIDRLTLERHPRLVDMFQNWNNNDYINSWCRERATKNIELSKNSLQRHPYHPAYLYEAGISEITKLNITGVIWYQGESNEHNVELHEVIFPTLVKSWRKAWDREFPFYFVQLSSTATGRETWGHLRDSQRRLSALVPKTGMAVSSDLGDSTDVHPRQKKQIGERLARWALNRTYEITDIVPSGPLFRDLFFDGGEGWLFFEYAEGLHTSDGEPLRSFELAEYPGLFYPATAEVIGNVVRVSSKMVRNPKYVRYGWSSFSDGNLVNGEELPASTFSNENLAVTFAEMIPSRTEHNNTNNDMKITWTKLTTKGLNNNLAKGLSATYAALIDNKLVVAGGANFPGKPGFEGGSKAFYNEIMLYDSTKNKWKLIGHLPHSSAYGVSVPVSDGALWIGGSTASQSLKSVYRISLSGTGTIDLKPFPGLPATMDNFAGCSIGDKVFIGGGNVNGKPSNTFYFMDAKTDSGWTVLPDYPGLPRVQPVMAAVEEEGKPYVYLFGGFFGGDTENKPAMATDVLCYDVTAGKWGKAGEQIDPGTGKPFSLGGAAAMPVDNRYILCLGGVNHDLFLYALASQHSIAIKADLTADERKQQNFEFSKNYMTQPIEYYKFNQECRIFDTFTGKWKTIDVTPNTARAGATLVFSGKELYAVQGELKPGVRTPVTIKGEIDI